jgi:hypothetical protein
MTTPEPKKMEHMKNYHVIITRSNQMPRRTRISLVTGLSFMILGLLARNIVLPVVIELHNSRLVEVMPQVVSGLHYGGLVMTVASFLYSFLVLAIWFVGPPEG